MPRQTKSFLIERFREMGIAPATRHGQNFLIDLNLVQLIVRAAELGPDDVVLEVGTGTGSLTAMMAAQAAAVVTVEIDGHLFELASEELVDLPNVTMLHLDALHNKNRFDDRVMDAVGQQLAAGPGRRLKLVANLPYNIATPVVSNMLLCPHVPHSMVVTIQKELADRMTAQPSTKDYGALSVWMQSQCTAEMVRVMAPTVFWPEPKVTSAILRLVVDPRAPGRDSRSAVLSPAYQGAISSPPQIPAGQRPGGHEAPSHQAAGRRAVGRDGLCRRRADRAARRGHAAGVRRAGSRGGSRIGACSRVKTCMKRAG